MVLLPRLLKDDYNVFVQDGARRAERLTEAFLGGMGKLRALGGLAVLATHTQIVGTGPRLDAVRAAADTARAQGDWWVARAGEVADWWERRRRIGLSFAAGRGIFVEAPADADVEGVWVDVVLPGGTADLAPQIGGTPVPFSTTDFGLRIPVGDLRAGETRRISLRSIPFDVGQERTPPGINGEEGH